MTELPDIPSQNTDSQLHSTFALQQLSNMATRLSAQMFTHLLRPLFGNDLPPTLFVRLKQDLDENTLENPVYQVSDTLEGLAVFDASAQVTHVSREAIAVALEQHGASAKLLMAMLEAFARYIESVIERYLAEAGEGDAPLAPRDAAQDLGTGFTQTLLFYGEPVEVGTTFATYTQSGLDHPLTFELPQDDGDDEPAEELRRRKKRFAAGSGDESGHESFGHESIEAALKTVGFTDDECKAIYFGNWLRDYSQLIDAKIVHPAKDATIDAAELARLLLNNEVPRVSRAKLTAIVDLLALKAFHSLQSTPEGRQAYKVTPKMLGVYRPHEHIDNPTTLDRDAIDPKTIDSEFSPLVFPDDPRNAVMPKRSLKKYIRRPVAYMERKLEAAMKEGKTPTGMRYFGEALHVLEDYFAHSNFVELSLRKLGHAEVLVWTTAVESREASRHEWPVVTGMFSALDIVGSVIDPLAKLLYPDQRQDTESLKAGERSDFDQIMLILLSDEQDTFLLSSYNLYLEARDKVASNPLYKLFNKIKAVAELPSKTVDYATNLIKKPLLKWAGDHVATLQVYLDKDPNTDSETLATHSQLAKDHDTHPFHTLAVQLATQAVANIGQAMFEHWAGNASDGNDLCKRAKRYISHPNDVDWYVQIVNDWAQGNPQKIEQGKSIDTLRQLQTTELDEALAEVAKALGEAERYVAEIEELTNTSFWSFTNLPDTGPAPWV
ncbi:hypothetical protein P0Y43_06770 [Pseudomonas entomophila]|uniref:HET-C-related protein n=1 Tax=Pseudomonas entomophila TaxID=312306 RepID=UPI0023D7DA2E|nr:HET-C-related protein [Pseudomonas entomophila]MDF0730434.1 hypothetical protein [Pseudomonas entomophila]